MFIVINLTPHPVTVAGVVYPPSGKPARCKETTEATTEIGGHVVKTGFQYVEPDLPEQEDGVLLVVPIVVAQAARDRKDLIFPIDQIRDEQGRIVGAGAFGQL